MLLTKIITPDGVTEELHHDLSLLCRGTRVFLLTHDLDVYRGYYHVQDEECVYLCKDMDHRTLSLGIPRAEIVGWAECKDEG